MRLGSDLGARSNISWISHELGTRAESADQLQLDFTRAWNANRERGSTSTRFHTSLERAPRARTNFNWISHELGTRSKSAYQLQLDFTRAWNALHERGSTSTRFHTSFERAPGARTSTNQILRKLRKRNQSLFR